MDGVRCFRRSPAGKLRHGLWIMTRPTGRRGLFIHGDHDAVEGPSYTVEELESFTNGPQPGFPVNGVATFEEITPRELFDELANWPACQEQARAIFARHGVNL